MMIYKAFALVIYTPFGVIWYMSSSPYKNSRKYLFCPSYTKNAIAIAMAFFYPSQRLGISPRRSRAYHQGRLAALASHHAKRAFSHRFFSIYNNEGKKFRHTQYFFKKVLTNKDISGIMILPLRARLFSCVQKCAKFCTGPPLREVRTPVPPRSGT